MWCADQAHLPVKSCRTPTQLACAQPESSCPMLCNSLSLAPTPIKMSCLMMRSLWTLRILLWSHTHSHSKPCNNFSMTYYNFLQCAWYKLRYNAVHCVVWWWEGEWSVTDIHRYRSNTLSISFWPQLPCVTARFFKLAHRTAIWTFQVFMIYTWEITQKWYV